MNGLKYRINRKFLFSLLVLSSVFTSILASIDIVQDYKAHVLEIENTLNEVESSFKESLKKAMWEIDLKQMDLILEGIKSVPRISYIEIERESGEKVTYGSLSKESINKSFILTYDYRNRHFYLGKVYIEADLEPVYQSVFDRAIVVIGIYVLRAILTSILILVILNQLILKDIIGLTEYFSKAHEMVSLRRFLSLRSKYLFRSKDEIDLLISEVNTMQENLKVEYDTKLEAQSELESLNEKLEVEIDKRVSEIRIKDKQLSVQESYKTMNEIAGHVAHELNNPLAILKGYLEIVDAKMESEDYTNIKKYFEKAINSLERVTKVSKSLTNLVNMDQDIQTSDVQLSNVIEDLDIFLKTYLQGKNIKFSYDLGNAGNLNLYRSKAVSGQILVALTKDLVAKCSRDSFQASLLLKSEVKDGNLVVSYESEGLSLNKKHEQSFDFRTAMDESMGLWFAQNTLLQINAVLHYYSSGSVLLRLEIPLVNRV